MRTNKKTASTVVVSGLAGAAAAVLAVNLFFGGTRLTRSEYETLQKTAAVAETLSLAEKTFYGELPDEETMVSAAANGMVAALGDPYARYYTAEEYENYQQEMAGEYVGVGITITSAEQGGALVIAVNGGSPAENAGILAGDILIKAEGKDVTRMSLSEITSLVLGQEGETAELVFLRDGERLTFTVAREKQITHQIHSEMLEGEIGYILIERFSGDCESGFMDALAELRSAGMKALILDVRNNPGGSLDTVVNVADALLPEGVVVTVKSADGSEEAYRSGEECLGLPLAILVNGNSASASELLAGAIQDSGAGIAVGENTYGKGVVQSTWRLPQSGSWFKLTTAAYYTPAGRNIDGEGITPDIEAELPEEFQKISIQSLDHAQDTQLSAAVEYIRGELEKY